MSLDVGDLNMQRRNRKVLFLSEKVKVLKFIRKKGHMLRLHKRLHKIYSKNEFSVKL